MDTDFEKNSKFYPVRDSVIPTISIPLEIQGEEFEEVQSSTVKSGSETETAPSEDEYVDYIDMREVPVTIMTEHEAQCNILDKENEELKETVARYKSRCIALNRLVRTLRSKKYLDEKVQERLLAKGMT